MLHRIIEDQASNTPTHTLTDTQDEYDFIEDLVEHSKPAVLSTNHHYFIRTQFRYPLPVLPKFAARFRPPHFSRNVFYGAYERHTSFYEAAYHWLRERIHVKGLSITPEPRIHFTVDFDDSMATDICEHPDIAKIMQRQDYTRSHEFVRNNQTVSSILYPSCRDPRNGKCAAVFDIMALGERLNSDESLYFTYEPNSKACTISGPRVELPISISWADVA